MTIEVYACSCKTTKNVAEILSSLGIVGFKVRRMTEVKICCISTLKRENLSQNKAIIKTKMNYTTSFFVQRTTKHEPTNSS